MRFAFLILMVVGLMVGCAASPPAKTAPTPEPTPYVY